MVEESESPKSSSSARFRKSRSRIGSQAERSICFEERRSDLSVNLNNGNDVDDGDNGRGTVSKLASRSLSGLNRIGNLFTKKTSD